MEGLVINLTSVLLFAFFAKNLNVDDYKMLCVRVKKCALFTVMISVFSSVLFVAPSYAEPAAGGGELFAELISKGSDIFKGVRDIVYVVAGFGIIGVAVGGFFGNLNWKWLGAIIIGLMVIGMTASILEYVGGQGTKIGDITDTLK